MNVADVDPKTHICYRGHKDGPKTLCVKQWVTNFAFCMVECKKMGYPAPKGACSLGFFGLGDRCLCLKSEPCKE